MRPSPPRPLPTWLTVCASALLLFHLSAIVLAALDAPSGPWPNVGMVLPPTFARSSSELTRTHVKLLKVGHAFRFYSNRPGVPGAVLEVQLRDDAGQPLRDGRGEPLLLRFPDASANPWVRHRQAILARQLGDDNPVEPPMGEIIAPPGQAVPTVSYWARLDEVNPALRGAGPLRPEDERKLFLHTVPVHLVPRERPAMRPSDWEMVLVRSYARHLCRQYGAASAEVVRRTRDPIPPALLFQDIPPAAFDDLVANYGEVRP